MKNQKEPSYLDDFSSYAFVRSYSALALACQPKHHWYSCSGPLVLRDNPYFFSKFDSR